MTYDVILMLLISGIVVGIINTLAGGGTVITMTMFMVLGLPITVANGTNRIAVVMQNLAATITFIRKRLFNLKSGLLLAVPVIIGNIGGSLLATHINDTIFRICFGVVLFLILLYMIFDNHKRIESKEAVKIRPMHYFWFLLIGFYGGYIYIGLGYLILAISLWSMKLDIVTANILKGIVLCVAMPFSMVVFMINGQVDYWFGLIHGAGHMIGAWIASHYCINWGGRFVKGFTIAMVIICFADLAGIISLQTIFSSMMTVCR